MGFVLGRIVEDSDVDTLAAMLIGTAHLLFADRKGPPPPTAEAVHNAVTTVVAGVVRGT